MSLHDYEDMSDPDAVARRKRDESLLDQVPRGAHPELGGETLIPEHPEQLLTVFRLLGREANAWRGQADARWRIDSSLARRHRLSRDAHLPPAFGLTEANCRQVEHALIERARGLGFFPELGELELLARLQHQGAATRLLDFTRNAFIATWFAAIDEPDTTGLVMGVRLAPDHELTTSRLKRPITELLDHGDGRPLWWRPRELSPRMSAQQAVLAFGPIVDEEWGSIRFSSAPLRFQPESAIDGAGVVLITPELKAELNHRVWDETFGYTHERLFPDFSGFAQAHGPQRDFPPEYLWRLQNPPPNHIA